MRLYGLSCQCFFLISCALKPDGFLQTRSQIPPYGTQFECGVFSAFHILQSSVGEKPSDWHSRNPTVDASCSHFGVGVFWGVVLFSMSMVCFGWSTTLKKLDIRAPGGSCQKVLVYRLALRTAFVSIYSHACSVSPWQKFATTTTTTTTTTTATTATTTARDHRDHCDHHDRHDRHDPHDHRDHDPAIGRLRFPAGRLCARGAVESNDEKA